MADIDLTNMKKILATISAVVVLLATSCQKENIERVQNLEGHIYRVYSMTGTFNMVNLADPAYGKTFLLMYFQSGKYTGVKFFPDTSERFKGILGDSQELFFEYNFVSHLDITVPPNSADLVVVKHLAGGTIPAEQFHGNFQVVPKLVDNANGYELRSVEFKNGRPAMTIEIVLVE